VAFSSKEEALRAFIRMNGKYLGENLVSVRFLDREALERGDYGK
jgi:hypothetical protein